MTITDAEAARFLLQAQFAVTDTDLATLKANGYSAWLTASYNQALGQTGVAWLDSRGHNSITTEQRYFWPQFGDFMIWNQLLAGPDQMRKRLALALSEFFVVSLSPIDGFYPPYVIGAYWDVLTANVYGNFRTLLERITLNAGMGFFLNTKGNLKEDASGRQPDENYAREVMQLFTIGLLELNQDGTPRLDANNQPIETYGQSDITNLARVFTGYDWDYLANGGTFTDVAWHDYDVPNTRFATNPMWFNPANHSNLAVTFLGTTIPANTPGPEALRIALDRLVQPCEHRPVLRAADDPAPGDQQSFARLRRPRRRGLREQWRRRARRSQGRVDGHSHGHRSAQRARRIRHALGQIARAGRSLRAMGTHRGHDVDQRRLPDLRSVRQRYFARAKCIALAVGVQLLPSRLRAA